MREIWKKQHPPHCTKKGHQASWNTSNMFCAWCVWKGIKHKTPILFLSLKRGTEHKNTPLSVYFCPQYVLSTKPPMMLGGLCAWRGVPSMNTHQCGASARVPFGFRFFKVFLSFWVSKNHNTCKLIKTWKYLLTELSLKSSLTSIWGSKITIKEVFLKNSRVKVLGFRIFFNF